MILIIAGKAGKAYEILGNDVVGIAGVVYRWLGRNRRCAGNEMGCSAVLATPLLRGVNGI